MLERFTIPSFQLCELASLTSTYTSTRFSSVEYSALGANHPVTRLLSDRQYLQSSALVGLYWFLVEFLSIIAILNACSASCVSPLGIHCTTVFNDFRNSSDVNEKLGF